jgi:hypothetical protein
MSYDDAALPDGMAAIVARVRSVKQDWHRRDVASTLMRAVLAGDWEQVAPGAFTEDYPAPMVANRVKVMSKDVAASLAPLPSINCASTAAMSGAAQQNAVDRTRIASSYVTDSNLAAQMTDFATAFNTFGLGVFFMEPDFDAKAPRIRVRKGSNAYAVWNSQGETVVGFDEVCMSPTELLQIYPDAKRAVEDGGKMGAAKITVVRYSDKDKTLGYLPECGNYVVFQYAAPIPGECQFVCIPLPGEGASFSGAPRGAYDDLVYPLMADHEFRMLALDAAYKAVNAPLAVTPDVTDISYGPDAVIRSQQPQNIRKVATEIPQSAFQAGQLIREDLAVGGMSPEARTGNIQASVITGKGIEAASAGYSSQIANAQIMIAFALQQAIKKCFKMDEHLWGDVKKTITGQDQGAPYELTYTPKKTINGKYMVDISYGFLSGMAPNNALIFVLQAQSAGLISRDFAARQLPVGMNVLDEFSKIDLETLRNTLMQSMLAMAQQVPAMAMQGQDPTSIIASLSKVAAGIKKGKQLEDIVAEVFAPEPPPAPAAPGSDGAQAPPGEAGGGGPSSDQPMPGPLGPQIDPNQRPDLQQLFAGLNQRGNAVLSGGVSRQRPVAG